MTVFAEMEELEALKARRSMSLIPDEIIGEVLRRLPVKPLLRLRCVSKAWRSLIDSKHFIHQHLQHSLRSNSNRAILVLSSELHYVDLSSCNRLEINAASIQPWWVVASCDGLVLLAPMLGDVALWNPSMRKMSRLPEPPPVPDCFSSYAIVGTQFALGYDSKHDDYKVVRVVEASDDGGFSSDAAIYSLNSSSWKKTADFPYLLTNRNFRCARGVCLKDALHTVVKRSKDCQVIMAFDLGTEEHRELQMPPFRGGGDGFAYVEVLDGVLAAVFHGKEKHSSEIWLMKEYGVGKSWMKLLQFDPPISAVCRYLRPLTYSRSGEEVLLSYDRIRLKWYDLRKKRVKRARFKGLSASLMASGVHSFLDAELCVGSLVSPSSPAALEADKKKGLIFCQLDSEASTMGGLHKEDEVNC